MFAIIRSIKAIITVLAFVNARLATEVFIQFFFPVINSSKAWKLTAFNFYY